MNILDILNIENLKRKTATEFSGSCPSCGGGDRFIIQPETGPTGRYWCRQCGIKGDAIQYLRDFKNMGYREACEFLSIEPKANNNSSSAGVTTAPQWEPRIPEQPENAWQEKASSFVGQAVKNLNGEIPKGSPVSWKSEAAKVRQWLMQDRGLSEATILKSGLGWNPRDYFPTRKSWGLPNKEGQEKTTTKMYLAEGIVIPCRQDGQTLRIRIRRSNPGDGSRYILLSGSGTGPMILKSESGTGKAVIIVESELDALLLREKAGDIVTSIAMGSAQNRPDVTTDQILKQAEIILVSLDSDQAGAKESWKWWAEHYPNSKRWPPVNGKDPGEMYQAGVDVRVWVQAGLQVSTVRPQDSREDERKRKDQCHGIGRTETRTHGRIMGSPILGEVELIFNQDNPDQALVAGVEYSLPELRDLLSRKLNHDDLRTVHRVKEAFQGEVVL